MSGALTSFQFEDANFVAYLTAGTGADAPRAIERDLASFLRALTIPGALISFVAGSSWDWAEKVAEAARSAILGLHFDSEVLSREAVKARLDTLRPLFAGFELYALMIPADYEPEDKSRRFFREFTFTSDSTALVLMPDRPMPMTEIVDPFPALRSLAETPLPFPAVVFWTPRQVACALALEDAKKLFWSTIRPAMDAQGANFDAILSAEAARRRSKRILHLSDLHFGRADTNRRRSWLKAHLAGAMGDVDRVVVTGDLFDEPDEEKRDFFDEFRRDLEDWTSKPLLVVPGNHDVRRLGNAFGPVGRNAQQFVDLAWRQIEHDDDLRTTFVCFNSAEGGNLARGIVSEGQRLDRATELERDLRRRPDLADYLRIALVHHHPYAYETQPTALYERLLARLIRDPETTVAFEGAKDFMRWCASQRVSLVLHGHKHVPRHVDARVEGQRGFQFISVVGCGSTTGADKRPMAYDVVTLDPASGRWNVLFFHDEAGDGSGFGLQTVTVDNRAA